MHNGRRTFTSILDNLMAHGFKHYRGWVILYLKPNSYTYILIVTAILDNLPFTWIIQLYNPKLTIHCFSKVDTLYELNYL